MTSSIVAAFVFASLGAASLGAATAGKSPATAAPHAQPVRSLYTCAEGLSRVAFAPQPASCCNGALSCPQLLSTAGLVKSRRANRT